jgi:acetyl-CoA carboxylase carboxyl transferase subunit alpha
MATHAFDFERPILVVEEELDAARRKAIEQPAYQKKVAELEQRLEQTRREVYAQLTPWQRVQFARHMERPRSLDFIQALCTDWTEVHGDRGFADDQAVVCGFGRFHGRPITLIGQQKGKDVRENLRRNFGMMHPEGYRKAMRVMRLGEKFGMPILIIVDTPGAYPGIGAEERGQAEAIARNIRDMFTLRVPVIIVVVGEGASGGALGIGVGDRVMMLENAWYCVISPEGCAAILWRDRAMAPRAAEALKLTATDLTQLKVIDEVIAEPLGGAHRFPQETFANVDAAVQRHLTNLLALSPDDLLTRRFEKFRAMGVFSE